MKTNLEKWNYYLSLLNKKADVFMDTINPLIPDKFYLVTQIGIIHECTILNRHYSFGLYFNGKKPTKKNVENIKSIYDSEIQFKTDKAWFDYSYMWRIYDGIEQFCRTSIHIQNVFKNEFAFLNKEDAEHKAKVIIFLNEEENQFKEINKKDVNYNYAANGYKFLGWQNSWKHVYFDENHNLCSETGKPSVTFGYLTLDHPEYGKCRDLKHRWIEISHNQRGSENTVSCPICKIYWKYDCSD